MILEDLERRLLTTREDELGREMQKSPLEDERRLNGSKEGTNNEWRIAGSLQAPATES